MARFSMDFDVNGTVPFVKQKALTCWAAATAMMHGWRTKKSCTVAQALAKAGNRQTESKWNSWASLAAAGKTIPMDELTDLAVAMSLKSKVLRSYSDVDFYNLMHSRGTPLMVAGKEASWGDVCHFYVVTGMYNDDSGITSVRLNDPLEEAPGTTMDFEELQRQMDEVGRYSSVDMQVLHY